MKLIYFWIGFFLIHCSITSVKEGEAKIVERFEKTFKNSKYSKAATLLVHSDSLKIHLKSSAGLLEDQKSKVQTREEPEINFEVPVQNESEIFDSPIVPEPDKERK